MGLLWLAIFFIIVLLFKFQELLHLGLLFLLIGLITYFPNPLLTLPSLSLLVPFVLSVLFLLPFFPLRVTLSWMKKGTLDKSVWLLVALTGLLSTVALIIWALWSNKLGMGIQMMLNFSAYPSWLILSVDIPVFALINAFAEEVVYRGVLQGALMQVFRSRVWLQILQAAAFAAAHYAAGFPNGVVGYFLVLVYGILLGFLRLRTGGLLAPYVAHVLADLTIGYFLYWHISR